MSANSIDPQGLLLQMRALAAAAHGPELGSAPQTSQVDFSQALKQALETVNRTQQAASNLTGRFERGQQGVELAEVMVAVQKANISFQAATQVRNRLVSAYQDIMNMPI